MKEDKVVVSDDIFNKAAMVYLKRTGRIVSLQSWPMVDKTRDELADLAERILALKDVGALK